MKRLPAVLYLLLALVACDAPRGTCRVTLVADSTTQTISTEARTVRELLAKAGITLDTDDRVTPPEHTLLSDGTTVRVIRVETRAETERREIPFDRRTVDDATVPAQETRLLEPGVTGIEELTHRVTLEDGVEVDRRLVQREIIREARTEVILIGTRTARRPIPITGTIAYVANHNAWLVQGTSLSQRRLTHSGDLDGRVFSLSAGGTHLLFTRALTKTEESGPLNTLWIVETSTAQAEPVRVNEESVLWAAWEPGGEVSHTGSQCRIAYTRGTPTEGNPGWQAENDLWVARPRPSTGDLFAKRQVLKLPDGGLYSWWGATYAWSPDGEMLAYARPEEVGVIRVRDGRRDPLHQFAPYRTHAPWVWTPSAAWSPEGAYVVTTLHGPPATDEAPEDSPVFDVWALSADGTITAELASEVGMWSAPTFSPDGQTIAFGRARSPYASHTSSYELHLMDRDGSDRRPIFPAEGEIGLAYPEMAWSPTGDQIVAVYQNNLYLIHMPDGNVQQLTGRGGVSKVRWVTGHRQEEEETTTASKDDEMIRPQDPDENSEIDPRLK